MKKPLKPGASAAAKKKRAQEVGHELKHGPVTSPSRKAAIAHGTAGAQNRAIIARQIGLDKKTSPSQGQRETQRVTHNKGAHRRKRNIGRS
jgi:hypothetical protein